MGNSESDLQHFRALRSPSRSLASIDSDGKCPEAETHPPEQEVGDGGLCTSTAAAVAVFPAGRVPSGYNSTVFREIPLIYHVPEYCHKVTITGDRRHYTLDQRRCLTTDHEEEVKSPWLKSLKTEIQVLPDNELRETGLILTLTLGSPQLGFTFSAKIEVILWDERNLKELGKVCGERGFEDGSNQARFEVALADRKRVERSSKKLKIIIHITAYGCQKDQDIIVWT